MTVMKPHMKKSVVTTMNGPRSEEGLDVMPTNNGNIPERQAA